VGRSEWSTSPSAVHTGEHSATAIAPTVGSTIPNRVNTIRNLEELFLAGGGGVKEALPTRPAPVTKRVAPTDAAHDGALRLKLGVERRGCAARRAGAAEALLDERRR